MFKEMETMVAAFEAGKLQRRQLLTGLGALLASALAPASPAASPSPAEAAPGGSTFQAAGLNHLALRVTDIPRSRDF